MKGKERKSCAILVPFQLSFLEVVWIKFKNPAKSYVNSEKIPSLILQNVLFFWGWFENAILCWEILWGLINQALFTSTAHEICVCCCSTCSSIFLSFIFFLFWRRNWSSCSFYMLAVFYFSFWENHMAYL